MTLLTLPARTALFRGIERVNATLEQRFWGVSLTLLFLFFACSIVRDLRTPMWVDEFHTLFIAQQANPAEIVRATIEGCDGAPPLYAMMVHAIRPIVGSDALAVRLPTTIGFCVMLLCLAVFCRRRLPAAYALLAPLLAYVTVREYSHDGRGYGVVLGCAAGALLCWQLAVEGRRRTLTVPLLAFCLGLMTAMHYYAMFFAGPLLAAELVRWKMRRKLDWAILLAILVIPIVLLVHLPVIQASRMFQLHYWSPASWYQISEIYSRYTAPALIHVALAFGFLALFAAAGEESNTARPNLTPPEWVFTGLFTVMPLIVLGLSVYVTHAFVLRYVIWMIPGFAAFVVACVARSARGRASVGVVLLSLILGFNFIQQLRYVRHYKEREQLQFSERIYQQLRRLPDGPEPILTADVHSFAENLYYADDRIKKRIVFTVDRDLDLRYFGADTGPLLFSALKRRTNLPIYSYQEFIAAHPRFYVAALGYHFLPGHLAREGYSVVPVDPADNPVLFLVQAPERRP